ncbi:MAG: MFS transporter [Chloroflexi bacterium]|nr:MFS transporter [Chloroflexota bacterium]
MSAQAGALATLRSPTFATFWLAQAISRFGDPITLIALAAASFRLTGSAFVTSLAVLVATVPQATFGFFGGAIADALGHRRAMVACDLLRAGLIALVPTALDPDLPLALPYGLVVAAAVCAAVFNPARLALVPAITPPERLAASNAVVFATDRTVEILGALAAGLLVAVVGDNAFYVDALTFAISALLLTRLSVRESAPRPLSFTRTWRDAMAGIDFIRRSTVLSTNTAFSLLAQLSMPVFNGLTPVLVFRRFADLDADIGAAQFGEAEAAFAVGAVAGGLLLPRLLGRVRKGRLVIGGLALFGLALVLVAWSPTFELFLALLIVAGILNVVFFVPNVTIAQEVTPPALRGRVFGARLSLLSLSWLPVIMFGGALADRFPVSLLIGAAGAFTLVIALAATQISAISEVE